MIGTRLQFGRNAEIGANEATRKFGDELFPRSFGPVFPIAAEIAADTMRQRRPVGLMPISA